MVQSINPDRIVPVKEDLATAYNVIEVIRGWDDMKRRDFPIASGVELLPGDWAVLGNNGKLVRPSATPSPATFLVLSGTDRYDVAATGKATIVQNSAIVVRTTKYNHAVSYNVGDYLTVKDLGAGQAFVTKAAGSEPRLALVTAVGTGFLEFQVAPVAL